MKIGTKSVLFGAHCFFLHPWFVAWAWWRLYGFPRDIRLWIAFFVHDLGYWGKPNMDGPEGERHVEWGAQLMGHWFGPAWHDLSLYHSRFYAKRDRKPFSRLCVADKLACALEPDWLYLARVWLSGEIHEYMALRSVVAKTKYTGEPDPGGVTELMLQGTMRAWRQGLRIYCREWAYTHQDGRQDTWTPEVSHDQ